MSGSEAIAVGDVVLVHVQNQPAFFARVERIDADVKPGWWRVKLLILIIPLAVTTWTIDEEQIGGADFTMGGTPIRIEKVVAPAEKGEAVPSMEETGEPGEPEAPAKKARILSLGDRKEDAQSADSE